MTCKPYDKTTNSGGYCFNSLLSHVLGTQFDESCLACFAATEQRAIDRKEMAGKTMKDKVAVQVAQVIWSEITDEDWSRATPEQQRKYIRIAQAALIAADSAT